MPLREPAPPLVVPLPDLFDLGRALAWLRDNPDGTDFAPHIQEIAGRLAGVSVPATIMEDADEQVLQEVFDRINNRGKKLNAAEIFDAIHGGPAVRPATKLFWRIRKAMTTGTDTASEAAMIWFQ